MADDSEFVEITTGPESVGDEANTQEASDGANQSDDAASGSAEGDQNSDGLGEDAASKSDDDNPLRDDKGRYKGGAEARIAELTRHRREAERAAEYWKGLATQSGAKPGSDAAPASKPTADQFEDYGDYVEALTDWKADQRDAKTANDRAAEATKTAEGHRQAEWGARVQAAKANIPDFDAVMEKADTPTAAHVADAIMDAERGPELLVHLANNPEVVEALNTMSPYRAAIELGRIEASLGQPAERPKPRETTRSNAPAPITPVTAGSTTAKDPAKMDPGEYIKWRNEQLKG